MPRGGNRRRLRHQSGTLHYAKLLLRSMLADGSDGGRAFQNELDELYARYERLLRALLNCGAGGSWGRGGPPSPLHLDTFFETLLIPMPVRYPRPRALSPAQAAESEERRWIADTVTMKAHHKWMREGSTRADCDGATRFYRVRQAVWAWALAVERLVNPSFRTRESDHRVVRRFLGEVSALCLHWRLDAAWARNAMIDHYFSRAAWGYRGFLPVISESSWMGDDAIVVQVPGSDNARYRDERDRFLAATACSTVSAGAPASVTFTWTPTQEDQQRYEREQGASCVVVRYEPSFTIPNERDGVVAYLTAECACRLGRPLLKREVRALKKQIDPQMKAIRARFAAHGWRIESNADLGKHARWLAFALLNDASWTAVADEFSLEDQSAFDTAAVRRACKGFAEVAGLRLDRRRTAAA